MKDPLFKGWIQSFQVKRQQYFGGVFVGNHIHKALKQQLRSIFFLLGRCHSICNQLFIDVSKIKKLDKHHLPKTTKVKKVLMKTLWYHYALVSLCKIQDCLMQSRAAGTSKAAKKGEMPNPRRQLNLDVVQADESSALESVGKLTKQMGVLTDAVTVLAEHLMVPSSSSTKNGNF
ncbi:hypothetical protein EMCRGX_G014870 [Ephydatia muelleri]